MKAKLKGIRLVVVTLLGIVLAGCVIFTPLRKHTVWNHGALFSPDIAINIYQGDDRTGPLVGFVQNDNKWFAVPAGFEMFYFEFGTMSGGDNTISLNMQPGGYYCYELVQIAGEETPDIGVNKMNRCPNARPPAKQGMAYIYFSFPNTQALQAANR